MTTTSSEDARFATVLSAANGIRGRIVDRIADIMLAADDVRELAEIARMPEDEFALIDAVMQRLYNETNQLMHRLAD